MSPRIRFGLVALAAFAAGCDRPAPTASNEQIPSAAPVAQHAAERAVMDRLARRFARALADPAFRAYIKAELDRSPFVEHKLQFQRLLRASDRRVLREVAR